MFNSLKQRIIVMVAMVSLSLFGVMTGMAYFALQRDEADAMREMKEKVEIAYRVVEHYAELSNTGTITEIEAKKMARDTLADLRFGKEGYYFVTTKQGYVVLMPPRRDLENTNQWSFKDPDDYAFFQEAAKISIPGGYMTYKGVRFGGHLPDELYPKTSYVTQFPQWGWIIGTGVYMDEITANTHYLLSRIGYVFGLVWGLFLAGMVITFYPVPHYLREMSWVINRLRVGDMDCDVPFTERRDELGAFARSVAELKSQCSTQFCDLQARNKEARRLLIEKAKLMRP